jgi:hypothetical protein
VTHPGSASVEFRRWKTSWFIDFRLGNEIRRAGRSWKVGPEQGSKTGKKLARLARQL